MFTPQRPLLSATVQEELICCRSLLTIETADSVSRHFRLINCWNLPFPNLSSWSRVSAVCSYSDLCGLSRCMSDVVVYSSLRLLILSPLVSVSFSKCCSWRRMWRVSFFLLKVSYSLQWIWKLFLFLWNASLWIIQRNACFTQIGVGKLYLLYHAIGFWFFWLERCWKRKSIFAVGKSINEARWSPTRWHQLEEVCSWCS